MGAKDEAKARPLAHAVFCSVDSYFRSEASSCCLVGTLGGAIYQRREQAGFRMGGQHVKNDSVMH